jgi:hypothetical protein
MLNVMVSRAGGPNGLRIAHHLNEYGRTLCCDFLGEIYTYYGYDSVVMCGACVIKKEAESGAQTASRSSPPGAP